MSYVADKNLGTFPAQPGTYALILHLNKTTEIEVGKLGRFSFPNGWYLYVGSALGPGGLAGRLNRHLKQAASFGGNSHWHIDYLHHYTKFVGVWTFHQDQRCEHQWARCALKLPGASVPAPRFGSSDCRCPAHLFHFPAPPDPGSFQLLLSNHLLEEESIQSIIND